MKNFITKLKTKIARQWHELLTDPAGPHLVAMSFAIGVISEMLTIPTVGIAFVLMIVMVKWLKFSMTSTLVGYFFTKIVYIPLAPLELKIGKSLLHKNFDPHAHKWAWARGVLHKDAELLLGAVIIGGVLAVSCYFVIRQILVLRLKPKSNNRSFLTGMGSRATATSTIQNSETTNPITITDQLKQGETLVQFAEKGGFADKAALSQILGITPQELTTNLQAGRSLVEIAQAKGINEDQLISKIKKSETRDIPDAPSSSNI